MDEYFGVSPTQYQELWFLALQQSKKQLADKIASIKKRGKLKIDPDRLAEDLLVAAQKYLSPPSEEEIVQLEQMIQDWPASSNQDKNDSYTTIIKLIREYHKLQSQVQGIELVYEEAEEEFLRGLVQSSRFIGREIREVLYEAGVRRVRDIFTLDLDKLEIRKKKLYQDLSFQLAVTYSQKRGGISKLYANNLQERALGKVRLFENRFTVSTPLTTSKKRPIDK